MLMDAKNRKKPKNKELLSNRVNNHHEVKNWFVLFFIHFIILHSPTR